MVPGKSRTLRRATYCSSRWFFLSKVEPLQFGVGLGEGQDRRVARCNRLDLGIGEFLAADVLGTAGGVVAGDDLAK